MLQNENIDVSSAVEILDETRQVMVKMKSDKGLQEALIDARNLCNSIETEAEFLQEPEVLLQKKWKRYDYDSLDEAPPITIQANLLFCFHFLF
ncbi:hypothetical protein AVEN_174125-1 [Araneus ventricosus]|uniref:Uncharacterized protein n=1 Tax=Araneus ventricosus TaxID=182803 RepID=A0A4Y2T1S7_ARAVE|nr:hypothetical protein AVEN_174125-1 [Araneus ventricosus]